MRMPLLPADFTHARVCKPFCEKSLTLPSAYRSETEMREKIAKYIAFYNQKRPHTTLNYKTPEQYEDEFFQKLKKSIYEIEGSNF